MTSPYLKLQNYLPEPNTGCWLWLGALGGNGHPIVCIFYSKSILVHRKVYEREFNVSLKGKVLHHKCRTKLCINPYHMEVLNSQSEHGILHGKDPRKPYKVNEELLKQIDLLYQKHKSVNKVGRLLKLSPSTVSAKLHQLGYSYTGKGNGQRYFKK